MCEPTPVYELVCGELLLDPEAIAREVDGWLIRWHAERQKREGE